MQRLMAIQTQRPRLFQCILSGTRASSSCPVTNQNETRRFEDIPGARSLPIFGSLLDVLFYKNGLSKAILHLPQERVKEFGKIYSEMFTTRQQTINIVDPSDVERVLRSESSYPERYPPIPLFVHFWEKYKRDRGVFFESGVKWYKYRSSLSKPMLVPRSILQHTPQMNEIASDLIERLKTLRDPIQESATNNEVGNIDDELFKWSFESVSYAIFEKRFYSIGDNTDPKVQEFIQSISLFLGSVVPTAYFPPKIFEYYETEAYRRFVSSYNKMYEFAQHFIIERVKELENATESGETVDEFSLFQYLLVKKKFSEKELLACIIDLLFGGVDTTSNSMQWVLYELAKHPEKQAALFHEVTTTLPGQCSVLSSQLQNLPYLKAVVKETLRLHPVLPNIGRVLKKDLVLSGYQVPAGTQILVPAYASSRDPDNFHDPEHFLPERWLRSNEKEEFHKFAALPFGFGRRMCLGRRLAELEIHVLLFHIMKNFQLKYPKNESMDTIARGTLIPEKPVRVKFIDRK